MPSIMGLWVKFTCHTGWSLVTTATQSCRGRWVSGFVTIEAHQSFHRRCRLTNLYTPGLGSKPLVYRSATAWRSGDANFLALCSAFSKITKVNTGNIALLSDPNVAAFCARGGLLYRGLHSVRRPSGPRPAL